MDSPDDSDAYVPGVNNLGNLRPKLHARRSLESKAKVPANPSSVEESQSSAVLSMQELSQSLDELKLHPAANKRNKISLKDLCVEDKQRIANLIKELARVGEEREKAREELEKERKQYEQQILALVQQQEVILKERQEVEKQLMNCQNLLMQCHIQRPSLTAPPLPHTTQLQGIPNSLFASFGIPPGNMRPPVTALTDQEVAEHRLPQVFVSGSGPQNPFSHYTAPGTVFPSLEHACNLLAAGDFELQQPQQQCAAHLPSAAECNQPDVQGPHSACALPGQGKGLENNLSSHGNKEEIMKRFLASQLPEKDMAPHSAACKQHPHRQKHLRSPKKTLKHTPFLPPRMSSTHKSAEIGEFLSVDTSASHHGFAPLGADDSPESSAQGDNEDMNIVEGGGGQDHRVDQNRPDQAKVMFTDVQGLEKHHSPHGDGGDDRGHVHAFHKLTQMERRQQLLQQRAQLLEEQKRLKQILSEQEAMLKEKQQALFLRSNSGANYGSNRDPQDLVPQRVAIDTALERQRAVLESLEAQSKQHASPRPLDPSGQNQEYLKKQVALSKRLTLPHGQTANNHGNTFTVHPNTMSDIAKKLDYSLLSDQEVVEQNTQHHQLQAQASSAASDEECDDGSNDNFDKDGDSQNDDSDKGDDTIPLRIDAATSLSYRHIPRHVRPASTPQERVIHAADWEGYALNATHPVPTQRSCTPGEKTMTVLEIINSQAEGSPFHRHKSRRFSSPGLGQSQFFHLPRVHQETPPLRLQNRELHISGRKRDSDSGGAIVTDFVTSEESSSDDAEESQILEEIFFVK